MLLFSEFFSEGLLELGGEAHAARAAERNAVIASDNWSVKRERAVREAQALAGKTPMAPRWLMYQLVEMLPEPDDQESGA